MDRLVVLGSTGSIGRQTLEVVRAMRDRFEIVGLAAGTSVEKLAEQAREFRPTAVAIGRREKVPLLRELLAGTGVDILEGEEGVRQLAALPEAELVVSAMVGMNGLLPTLAAIENGKRVALANKEVLVAAGDLVIAAAAASGAVILPVDSEHNALFQCLQGEERDSVSRVLLTASGGPFRGFSAEELAAVTTREALRHPRWNMGPKITIDSATLMNKGLEVIEAHHLFGLRWEQIGVLIHPESIVHSLVEFVDGSLKAQLSVPDMRHPIQFALTYPGRRRALVERLDLARLGRLTFEEPDLETFPCLKYAYQAGRMGGTAPAVLNAANEVAVATFLREEIPFASIPRIILTVLEEHKAETVHSIQQVLAADAWARDKAGMVAGGTCAGR